MIYTFVTKAPLSEQITRELNSIPGIKAMHRRVHCPDNACFLATSILDAWRVEYEITGPKDVSEPLNDLQDLVRNGLREWVPDFLTPYQRDGIKDMAGKSGLMIWAAGCLAGDSEIVVNRGGCARRMRIDDLVFKFNGGESTREGTNRKYAWDLSIPTFTQSVDEKSGFIVKNKIIGAVDSGEKLVFKLLTESGQVICATADHRFWTPKGWVSLSGLSPGDDVMIEVWPKAQKEKTPKKQYVQVDQMWNHPNAVVSEFERKGRPGTRKQARVPLHRLNAEARMNGVSLYELVGRIVMDKLDGLEFLDKSSHVHHIDGNHLNNDISNLEIMSQEQHFSHHGKEDSWKSVCAQAKPCKVVSIEEVGIVPTYDLMMADPHNSFVANGIVVHNSGKTLASICWALHTPGKTILCTRAPVRKSHGREIEKYTTKRAFVVEGETPIDFRERDEDFIVLGYETLPAHIDNLIKWRPINLILDECHKIKSSKRYSASPREDGTVQFQMLDNIASAAMRLSRAVNRTLGTTATPVKNRVQDLWAQLDLCQPGEWGPFYKKDATSWARRYCAARPGAFGGIDTSGSSNLDELWDRVSVISNQVAYSTTHRDLPPKRRVVTYVPQSEQVRATGFQKEFKAAAKGGAVSMMEVRLMEAAAKKRKYVLDILSDSIEAKHKVVVFTGRRADCDKLGEDVKALMEKLDPSGTVLVGHGGVASSERDQMQQTYMSSPGPCILIGTGDAWGEGVNLNDSDLHLIVMLPYTPGQVIQWEGRCCRLGMKRPVMIQYLIAENTVDEHVAGILVGKLPAVEQMVGDDSVNGFGNQLLTGDMTEEEFMDQLLGKLGLTSDDAVAEE